MNINTPICALLALMFTAEAGALEPYQTGLEEIRIIDAEGGRHLQGFLWYPTDESEGLVRAHGNAVWEPVRVIPDAAPIEGERPLLVMSHGMYGNARNQAWLAEALTQKGYIVAAIDHPGTSTFQRDPDQARELWERPKDISRLIDYIVDVSDFGQRVDQERIFMAGHSLGGFTAVALAGGRYDAASFEAFCGSTQKDVACGVLNGWGVAKTPEDKEEMSADLSDSRISGFAVFDLGGTQSFSKGSLASIQQPMLVMGAPQDISGLDLDTESRALVAALEAKNVRYTEPPTLSHFDFLGVCAEGAIAILTEEEPEDVFICEEGRDKRRAEHEAIVGEVTDFFKGL